MVFKNNKLSWENIINVLSNTNHNVKKCIIMQIYLLLCGVRDGGIGVNGTMRQFPVQEMTVQ